MRWTPSPHVTTDDCLYFGLLCNHPSWIFSRHLVCWNCLICVCNWSSASTLYACCAFSQPRQGREHGGAGRGHCCCIEPNELHLPAHTGRPLRSCWCPTECFVSNISILLELYLISDINTLVSGSARRTAPDTAAEMCFCSLRFIVKHATVCLCSRWKWWTRWRIRSATTAMMRQPYCAWSKKDKARKRSAGKTPSLGELLESWVRFYSSKQLDRLAWDQQSAFIHVVFIILLWCWNEIKHGWSWRNTDQIPVLCCCQRKVPAVLSPVVTAQL